METQRKVIALVDSLQFGYWDMEDEEFVPIDEYTVHVNKGVASLGCSEALLIALSMFAEAISETVGADLRDIWARLDSMEKK